MKEVYVIVTMIGGVPDEVLAFRDEKKAERRFRRLLSALSGASLDGLTEEQIDEIYDTYQQSEDAGLWLFRVPVRPRRAASSARGS